MIDPKSKIETRIYEIRGVNVMLDSDLASLYGIQTKALKQAVKRNIKRFPVDFMFIPDINELADLRSQFVTSNDPSYWNHNWADPYLFTANGVAMLSSILKSDQAIEVNISIMRIFTNIKSSLKKDSYLKKEMDQFKSDTNKIFNVVFERLDNLEVIIEPKLNPKRKKIGLKDVPE